MFIDCDCVSMYDSDEDYSAEEAYLENGEDALDEALTMAYFYGDGE